MARRQTELPGTRIKTDVPEVVVESVEQWLEDRRAARNAREKAKTSLAASLQLMAAHGVAELEAKDVETGERVKLRAKITTTLSVVKIRDDGAEFDISDGLDGSVEHAPAAGPHPSLIRQAEADALATNVEVNEEGDVGVPDTAAPKSKAKRKPKKAAAKAKDAEGDPVVTTGDGKARSVPKRGDDAEGGAN